MRKHADSKVRCAPSAHANVEYCSSMVISHLGHIVNAIPMGGPCWIRVYSLCGIRRVEQGIKKISNKMDL